MTSLNESDKCNKGKCKSDIKLTTIWHEFIGTPVLSMLPQTIHKCILWHSSKSTSASTINIHPTIVHEKDTVYNYHQRNNNSMKFKKNFVFGLFLRRHQL